MENKECTILCMVSRFLAALADLRFILSCRRLQPSAPCMLSIDQYSLKVLGKQYPEVNFKTGKLLNGASQKTVDEWVKSL